MPRKAATTSRSQRRALFDGMVDDLRRERDDLMARLEALGHELAEYGHNLVSKPDAKPAAQKAAKKVTKKAPKAAAPKAAPKVAKKHAAKTGARAGSLKDHILSVVGAKAMSPAEIAAAAVKGGYKSASKTLPQSVSVACAQLVTAGQLKKEGRGQFRSA